MIPTLRVVTQVMRLLVRTLLTVGRTTKQERWLLEQAAPVIPERASEAHPPSAPST